jgi:DNA-binding PadR family transcriptional regulator
MNTTIPRPTPETDAFILANAGFGPTDHQWREHARKMEREQDEALAKLSTVYRWIEKNHSDGFIDSQTHVQNLDRIADAWYEKLEAMRDELQKVCQQRDAWAMRCDKLGVEAMREAIKEAYQVLQAVPVEYDSRFFRAGKWTENALAKLQPFIK